MLLFKKLNWRYYMNDTFDITTLSIRMLVFVVIAGIFYFILKSKKNKEN